MASGRPGLSLAACLPAPAAGAETARESTDRCTIRVTAGKKGHLTDHNIRSN